MNIFCFGISHQTANVEVRERFAIPDSALADSLMRLAQISSVDEGVLLSTCNRTEFYIVSPDSQLAVEPLFHDFYGPVETTEFQHCFRLAATPTIRHLFRVASGLESMVVGETEIFGQVKRAGVPGRQACAIVNGDHAGKCFCWFCCRGSGSTDLGEPGRL